MPQRRVEESDRYYLLSNRTQQGEFLFRPDDECRRIVKGCLARAADKHDVRLVSYVFPSNHFHLVAGFPKCNRGPFMKQFQSQLSNRINNLRDRTDVVFPRPYHAEALLDSKTLLDAINYTANNAVRHGLVPHADDWPGVHSREHHRSGDPLVGHWFDHNEWHNLSRRKEPPERKEAFIEHTVELHLPEMLPGDDAGERRKRLNERIEEGRREFCQEQGLERHTRKSGSSQYETVNWQKKKAIDEDWSDIRPACAGEDPSEVAAYLEWRREIDDAYRQAADAWKRGRKASFPVGTYPPGRSRCTTDREPRAPPDG